MKICSYAKEVQYQLEKYVAQLLNVVWPLKIGSCRNYSYIHEYPL